MLRHICLQELVIVIVFAFVIVALETQIGFVLEKFLADVVEGEIVQAVTEKTQLAQLKIFGFG
ncbi:MAG: hypothetical protein IJS81_01135 [Selenomonadaceae bacterium]|nr:hypothetical protein [Selenomonadaceae bacterium]